MPLSFPVWHVAALLSTIGAMFALPAEQSQGKPASLLLYPSDIAPLASAARPQNENELTPLAPEDATRYRALFALQSQGKWQEADAADNDMADDLLLGHALAQRYLSARYPATPDELGDWLTAYADHPQARAIASLSALKGRPVKNLAQRPRLAQGGDAAGTIYLEDTPQAYDWHAGLDAWKAGRTGEAAQLFASVAAHDADLSPAAAATAAYWAARAYEAQGDKAAATRHLKKAANAPRSFYGILARARLHQHLQIDSEPEPLKKDELRQMMQREPVRRAVALVQVGQDELAEKELREIFPRAGAQDKRRLLALAHTLNLASVQISMAAQLDGQESLDFAHYPVPGWEPAGGFTIDPALVFALVRQESGFLPAAVSPGGALGLMQLMPRTASMMKKSISAPVSQITEPVTNLTLGQSYVRRLLDNALVDGNLIYLLAAYNAGPGRLQDWKAGSPKSDPLLFIETIPFAQTRHYVTQVMANYWIYSELAGRTHPSISALLKNRWPEYGRPATPFASMAQNIAG